MTVVMGLDQHRAQITAEWLDTETGEVSRARVMPADRDGVRGSFRASRTGSSRSRWRRRPGWRFVVEELAAVGAQAHLAEPAEASALKGNKKRAKTDRADARHLRELLMAGRLPESYIAPAHVLDLRARVRLRHSLVDQRGEWQQRIHAVLYHHGHPQKDGLLRAANRAWLEQIALPDAAREQVTVALAMIDALDAQAAPITAELRRYARRQPGCKALMGLYGVGELTAVAILAELGDPRRFSFEPTGGPLRRPGHHGPSVRPAPRARAPLTPRTARAALGALRSRPSRAPARQPRPRLLRPSRRAAGRQPRLPRPGAQAAQAQLPHPARARRPSARAGLTGSAVGARAALHSHRCPAARSPHIAAATCGWTASKDRAAAPHHAGTPHQPSRHRPCDRGSRTEISPGARAHHTRPDHRAHDPPLTPDGHRR